MKWSLLKCCPGYFHHFKYLHLQTLLGYFCIRQYTSLFFKLKYEYMKNEAIQFWTYYLPALLDHDRILSLFHDQSDNCLKTELPVTACNQGETWCKVFLTLLPKIKKVSVNYTANEIQLSFSQRNSPLRELPKNGTRSWWTLLNFSISTILLLHLSS